MDKKNHNNEKEKRNKSGVGQEKVDMQCFIWFGENLMSFAENQHLVDDKWGENCINIEKKE